MNADDVTATATVAGVVVAGLFGASGLAVGIVGLVQARQAKTAATRANKIAKDANALSKKANELVEVANKVISEQTARETERSDVAWEWRWDDTTHTDYVIIQNIGKSLAKDVVAQFFFETSVEANDFPIDIEGRREIKLEIPALSDRRKFAAEAQLNGVAWAIAQRDPNTPIPPDETARVRLRVTPRGASKLHDSGYRDESLLHNAH